MLEVGNNSCCEWTALALCPGLLRGGQVLLDCLHLNRVAQLEAGSAGRELSASPWFGFGLKEDCCQ